MSALHTPGPWSYDDRSGDAGGLVVWAANGDRFARVCWYGDQSETPWATEANARLIATAPRLLDLALEMEAFSEAAMNDAIEAGDEQDRVVWAERRERCRSTIASATGGST